MSSRIFAVLMLSFLTVVSELIRKMLLNDTRISIAHWIIILLKD